MNKPLNICVVTQQLKNIFSGPGTYSNLLIKELRKLGHNIHVILPKGQLSENVNFSYQTIPNSHLNSHARWIEQSFYFNKAINATDKKFDIIHFTDVRDSYFVKKQDPFIGNFNDTYVTKKQSVNYFRNYYSDWLIRFLYYRFSRFIELRKINSLDIIIANSQYTKKILLENYPWINEKTFVCYKTIDFSQKISNQNDSGTYNILFVGGNMERKGIISLIRSSKEVIRQLINVRYHIIGQDPKINKYKKICESLGVRSNFVFHGNLSPENRNKYYMIADLFLMPSIDEAFGIVFLEAMANDIPVIGSMVGGIPEIITHYENGILVNPDDIEEISKQTINLLTNKELRKRIINNSKKTTKKYSNEEMIECTNNLYSKLKN